jgi:hypothetical protein
MQADWCRSGAWGTNRGIPSSAEPAVKKFTVHDLTAARAQLLGALYAAAARGLPTLADSGYDGADIDIHTPIKQPDGSQILSPDNRTHNRLLRALRCLGERGFALLKGRWRTLQHITVSPRHLSSPPRGPGLCRAPRRYHRQCGQCVRLADPLSCEGDRSCATQRHAQRNV